MSEEITASVRFVIAGCLNRDTILPVVGEPRVDVLGGNLPYAAVGLKLWGETSGLVARIDEDFPLKWLDHFEALGFDLSGLRVLPEPIDARRFMAHADSQTTHYQNPVQHFAERGLPFPPILLGYRPRDAEQKSRQTPSSQSIQLSDVPKHYLEASAVHICPIDYLSHMILPAVFRQGMATTITLSSHPGYMSTSFWEEIPGLLSEITAFVTTEEEIRTLFQGRETDLWQMVIALGDYGPEFILVRTAASGYYLYDRLSQKRWIVPIYPSKVVDPTGIEDGFAGGFLAGYRQFYDPLEAALRGSIAASFVMEGGGVFYALDALPSLVEMRLSALRDLVREV